MDTIPESQVPKLTQPRGILITCNLGWLSAYHPTNQNNIMNSRPDEFTHVFKS